MSGMTGTTYSSNSAIVTVSTAMLEWPPEPAFQPVTKIVSEDCDGKTWEAFESLEHATWRCGHKHRSCEAARRCGRKHRGEDNQR